MDGAFGLVFGRSLNEILLVKRRDVPVWVVPGGGIEKNETPEEAVVREIFEESGYRIKVRKEIARYIYRKSKKINYLFDCKIISGKPTTSSESKDVRFFSIIP